MNILSRGRVRFQTRGAIYKDHRTQKRYLSIQIVYPLLQLQEQSQITRPSMFSVHKIQQLNAEYYHFLLCYYYMKDVLPKAFLSSKCPLKITLFVCTCAFLFRTLIIPRSNFFHEIFFFVSGTRTHMSTSNCPHRSRLGIIQGVQVKLCFFTINCNPSLAYIAVRDLQCSQRNAIVQSLLLAGNFLYNQQQQPSAGEGEVANFREFLKKRHNI